RSRTRQPRSSRVCVREQSQQDRTTYGMLESPGLYLWSDAHLRASQQGVITMSATKVSPTGTGTTTPRSGRSVLDVVMLVGLFLVVVADGVAQALEGAIIPPVVVFQALYLLCGIVVATRWRWAMLLPLVICPLGIVADFASGFPEYT